jgi:hypothetical protein
MFDYKQRVATDEYRDNWERVFAESAKQRFMEERINEAVHELTRLIREDMDVFYANGCPILEDECPTSQLHRSDTSTPTGQSSNGKA